MSRWPLVPLRDLGDLDRGKSKHRPRNDPALFGGAYPFIQTGDVANCGGTISHFGATYSERGLSQSRLWPRGTLCITIAANIARTGVLDFDSCFPDSVVGFVPKEGVDAQFVQAALDFVQPRLERLAPQMAQKNINLKILRSLPIPLPPLAEQRRIVDILNRADSIHRLRREAREKARQLIPALFVDMFGDPATNPKGWGVKPFGELVEIVAPLRKPNMITESDLVCLGPDAIESENGQILECDTVGEVRPRSAKYAFDAGEILYSKIRPYLAKAAIAPFSGYCSADMYPLKAREGVKPEFILWVLLSTGFTEFATNESIRARMPKLNRRTLFGFGCPLPPKDAQSLFAERVADIQSSIAQQDLMAEAAGRLQASLMAQVFDNEA